MLGRVEMQKYRKIGPYAEGADKEAKEVLPRDNIVVPDETVVPVLPGETKTTVVPDKTVTPPAEDLTTSMINALRRKLEAKGIEYHHRAGEDKLKKLLADADDIDNILE